MNTVSVKASTSNTELFRKIPAIDELLRHPDIVELAQRDGQAAVTGAVRAVVGTLRDEISRGALDEKGVQIALSSLPEVIRKQLQSSLRFSLRWLINATGVILHTNLGRAPLLESALEHIRDTAFTYSNLEFDLEAGERGKRDAHVERLFKRVLDPCAPEARSIATVVVNNNAAAVMIALNTLAEGGEVIVSRGELVEIGGSFRVPDVMAKSNAILREVGTTNRTRIADYENAINEKTRLLLRVHRSNFEIVGFTEQPSLEELVDLGKKHNLPVMEDLGSGALFDLHEIGVNGEPGVGDSIRNGVDIVTYSGDKLLGGPQAGIISGDAKLVAKIRANPLFRALRVDKLIYAALEATLLAYVKGDVESIPAIRMMRLSKQQIAERASRVANELKKAGVRTELIDGESVIGGGAAPGSNIATTLLAITSEKISAGEMAKALRENEPPVIVRIEDDRLIIDLRTVFPAQDGILTAALRNLL